MDEAWVDCNNRMGMEVKFSYDGERGGGGL